MDTSLDGALAEWLKHLEHVRRVSPHTLSNYRRDVLQLRAFLEKKHPGLKEFSRPPRPVRAARLSRRAPPEGRTCIDAAQALGPSWLLALVQKRQAHQGFARSTPRESKRAKQLPRSISVDEAFALCQAPDVATSAGLRDAAIIELLYGPGLRVSELCGLDTDDIDVSDRSVRVIGKGNKERVVPFHDVCAAALAACMQKKAVRNCCARGEWQRTVHRCARGTPA